VRRGARIAQDALVGPEPEVTQLDDPFATDRSSVNNVDADEHTRSGWSTLVIMSRTLTLTLPDETVAAVERVAAARGVSVEELVGEWAATADPTPVSGVRRRRLALAGVVSSGGPGISGRVDELLANGFGAD
jgi:hypothetical protein